MKQTGSIGDTIANPLEITILSTNVYFIATRWISQFVQLHTVFLLHFSLFNRFNVDCIIRSVRYSGRRTMFKTLRLFH